MPTPTIDHRATTNYQLTKRSTWTKFPTSLSSFSSCFPDSTLSMPTLQVASEVKQSISSTSLDHTTTPTTCNNPNRSGIINFQPTESHVNNSSITTPNLSTFVISTRRPTIYSNHYKAQRTKLFFCWISGKLAVQLNLEMSMRRAGTGKTSHPMPTPFSFNFPVKFSIYFFKDYWGEESPTRIVQGSSSPPLNFLLSSKHGFSEEIFVMHNFHFLI